MTKATARHAKAEAEFKAAIRRIPNFPKKGIIFRDITTLWKDGRLLRRSTDVLYEHYKNKKIDAVLGIEAQGLRGRRPPRRAPRRGIHPLEEAREAPRRRRSRRATTSSTGPRRWRCTGTRSRRARGSSSWTTSSPPGGPPWPRPSSSRCCRGTVVGFAFVVELSFLRRARRPEGLRRLLDREVRSEEE